MSKTKEERIVECQNAIRRYEQYGKALGRYSLSRIANFKIPIHELTLHYGMEYEKAIMKLKTLHNDKHTEKEIEQRLKQIDIDISLMEDILKQDLDFRGLLLHP